MSVSAAGPSLLELLPDTGRPAYRLVVELRHDGALRGDPRAEVGVYFACREHLTEEGPQFFFGRVSFADKGARRAVLKDKAGRPAGKFQIGLDLLGASRTRLERTYFTGWDYLLYQPEPAANAPGPWRRLEIEVRPGACRARHWDGKTVQLVPAAAWPVALAECQHLYPDLTGIQPSGTTRGPVGIFLEASIVSLRRFDVEPLAEGE